MDKYTVGQRFVSEPEPELGLGMVSEVDGYRVSISFPSSGEQRIYAAGTPVLKRVVYRAGERVNTRDGASFTVETVQEVDGLLVYTGENGSAREDQLSEAGGFSHPQDRLMGGQVDGREVFELRYRALKTQNALRSSDLRGFFGGRVDLIPHQYYILKEVSERQLPRVLLSDEVGLGKTIEACLILQRLRSVGRASRVLILVPEPLVHQWFVELLRRFNLWFSIFDETRCQALEASNEGGNPFLDEQLALCSVEFLADSEVRSEQAIEAGWDMVIVDEAHHLEWSPEQASPEYALVESLGSRSQGLLLLTATPTQLGLAGHFARLRLLDPDRYSDLASFEQEMAGFETVATIAGKVIDQEKLDKEDAAALQEIFRRDPAGLAKRLSDLKAGKRGSRESLLKALLDEHGTGRVVFRNTRAAMTGFPKRQYCPAPLESGENQALLEHLAKELAVEASGDESGIRYNFKGDPRIEWLVSFLRARKDVKVLLICKTRLKAMAVESALRESLNVKIALFHEELQLVQRDRNAAWFAEPDGAQILICSEIGSEGRNFQFAHHLVLFDLPINPGLLEQRIGRLDRIGQTSTIQIHVPYVVGSAQEWVAEWIHQGLDGFETCVHGGSEYLQAFGERVVSLAIEYGRTRKKNRDKLEAFIEETEAFREKLSARLRKGRDRLLELNSFDKNVASDVISRIRKAESDSNLKEFLYELLEFYGVRVDEQEGGDVALDPSHAFVEAFPSLPADGALATFDRSRAIAREDMMFVSPDHSLVFDAIDLLTNSEKGVSSFCIYESYTPGLSLELIFVLETVALSKLHVDRFLSPTPVRVVVGIRGDDLTGERDMAWAEAHLEDGDINRFLERPGFNREFLEAMVGGAEEIAEKHAKRLKAAAKAAAKKRLGDELQRLRDLQKINDNVRLEEVQTAAKELSGVLGAIEEARLRLDSLRLVVEGEVEDLKPL
ncbi:RNA polymerase-associated protein RapA [Pelagicoccus sp. SDUM812003]|uniref:RNA polymerase-associated protein RapA n=1 Tax=Pelagicoccus sp. SDUM812003 TaxID=3041267 RepID=UPI00280CC82F|nr:RNA polymerase-associated protein RapA [Pelagicoccus sp. SDUM812003]MDQ8201687.1 RNA polymerase-associated protein RapA [Pelagicoccus sp. SDUM812003]